MDNKQSWIISRFFQCKDFTKLWHVRWKTVVLKWADNWNQLSMCSSTQVKSLANKLNCPVFCRIHLERFSDKHNRMKLAIIQQIVPTFVPHHLHACINHANVLHYVMVVTVFNRIRFALFPNLSWLNCTINIVEQCIALFWEAELAKAISIFFIVENVDVQS